MANKFTVSELSRLLGVSVNTTWKKINKRGLITDKQLVNNREITVVTVDDEQLKELLAETSSVHQVNNPINNTNYEDSLSTHEVHEGVKVASNQPDMVQVIESIMNYSREMNNQVKEYVDRVINAEKQVKLLEDLENRKNADYLEISAKCRELESRLRDLEAQNAELKAENKEYTSKIEELQKQNAELKAALEEHARKKSWFSFGK